jgi:hypothetical protein
MIKQRKIDTTNLGRDTHVRDHVSNKFQAQNHETYSTQVGEIVFAEPEPFFRQNMVTVKLARGGQLTSVAYPGAFIDPVTGNLHGTYEGPISGQMVSVGFENGNQASPIVVNRYPYQGVGNSLTEFKYINPLTFARYDSTDVIVGHFSGSFLSFNTGILSGELPGSVSINAMTDFGVFSNLTMLLESLVTAEFKSAITTITGSTYVALNGITNFAVKYTEMKTAFDTLRTDLNNLTPGVISPTVSAGTPSVADMSAAQNTKVLM